MASNGGLFELDGEGLAQHGGLDPGLGRMLEVKSVRLNESLGPAHYKAAVDAVWDKPRRVPTETRLFFHGV
ncbi:MAG: hypothetical protein ACI9VR_004648 [Cognaticolwellia sp.]|jgi:hypothetical protein